MTGNLTRDIGTRVKLLPALRVAYGTAEGEYHGSGKRRVVVADWSAIADHHFAHPVLALIGCGFRLG